jgi:glycosyltransferase involved in cell wall biosynthesis
VIFSLPSQAALADPNHAMKKVSVSFIIPAKNEAASIAGVVRRIRELYPDAEVIVVDDGSTDKTLALAEETGAHVHKHPTSLGNGAAVKAGARIAQGEIFVFLDADGQHDPEDAQRLLAELDSGYGMAVGARSSGSHASMGRLMANGVYNLIASIVTGHHIPDLTSGFRAVHASLFRKYLYLLPNGFSYPTTITMALMRAGHPVTFVDIEVSQRTGKSHIKTIRDGIRFLIIIFKIATLYSPLKLFFPTSLLFFATGIGYYFFTFFAFGRFTNMSLLLLSAAVIVFLIGLISEQITTLHYRDNDQ